jgi:hypothetical protein
MTTGTVEWRARLTAAEQLVGDQALAPLELPALVAAAQLLGGGGAQVPLDVVEGDLLLGHGVGRHHVDAGHVSDVDDIDAAFAAAQQSDGGVERADGGGGTVIPDNEVQVRGGRVCVHGGQA